MVNEATKADIEVEQKDAYKLNEEAARDLERIEEEVRQEAEQYVEAVDGDGNEELSVEAAATAFDFDRAALDTEEIADMVSQTEFNSGE